MAKKILANAARYMSPKKKLYEKGKVYEMDKQEWESIPSNDKPLFKDPEPTVVKAETPEKPEGGEQ